MQGTKLAPCLNQSNHVVLTGLQLYEAHVPRKRTLIIDGPCSSRKSDLAYIDRAYWGMVLWDEAH